LREETEFRPKPMVEIGERPILWHIMKVYAHSGFREFVLCLGYRGSMIKDYFLNYEAMNNDFTISLGRKSRISYNGTHAEQGFEVTLAETGQDTMTGGRLRRVRQYVDGQTFMLTYGDGVADIDLKRLLAFHNQHGKIATVTTVTPTSRFGIMEMTGGGHVTKFLEKPKTETFASAGFFVFQREIFDYLDRDECILEHEPLQRLAADGQLMAYGHEGFFHAMDTYREYEHLNNLWAKNQAPWKVW
jgi:glucose-1-phosphate cytidylyltransferase